MTDKWLTEKVQPQSLAAISHTLSRKATRHDYLNYRNYQMNTLAVLKVLGILSHRYLAIYVYVLYMSLY